MYSSVRGCVYRSTDLTEMNKPPAADSNYKYPGTSTGERGVGSAPAWKFFESIVRIFLYTTYYFIYCFG